MDLTTELWRFAILILITLVWYLLRKKDEVHASEIKLLFEKHDADAKRLQDVELDLARRYYPKEELDGHFIRMEVKLDKLSEAILAHISREGNRI